MAFSRTFLLTLLLAFLALHLIDARLELNHHKSTVSKMAGRSLLATIDCGAACGNRCRLSSRSNLCKRACGTCCNRCSCVPPGTSGNEEKCTCYAGLTTRGGRKKCP